MLTDEEIRQRYAKLQEESPTGKYRWYMLCAVNPEYNVIFSDEFWTEKEKRSIVQLLSGEDVAGWAIIQRVFRGSHLDVCVIWEKA